jgi:hypothetical protein
MHRRLCAVATSSSHLMTFNVDCIVVSECRELVDMNVNYFSVAQHPYQIS